MQMRNVVRTSERVDVVHGHWIELRDLQRNRTYISNYCSECGAEHYYGRANYCPNCGARMDEGKRSDADDRG